MAHAITSGSSGSASDAANSVTAGLLAVALASTGSPTSSAEPVPSVATRSTAASGVPTTKMLAIGTRTAKASTDALAPVMPSEVDATVQLYLTGKLDQWFVKQDRTGVVFILNVTDPEQARAMLEQLPLGRAGLMEFQIIPLGPLSPLGMLLNKTNN